MLSVAKAVRHHRRAVCAQVVTTVPTIGFNVETVQYKNLRFQVWDLGGQTSIRPYWRCYYQNTNAIIYVVDSADSERMGISKQELCACHQLACGGRGHGQTGGGRARMPLSCAILN